MIIFLLKLVNGSLDCPEILGKLHFHSSRLSRRPQVLGVSHHSTSSQQHSAILPLIRTGNRLCSHVDIFNSIATALKREVKAPLADDGNFL